MNIQLTVDEANTLSLLLEVIRLNGWPDGMKSSPDSDMQHLLRIGDKVMEAAGEVFVREAETRSTNR
jgi:hypothetical protein